MANADNIVASVQEKLPDYVRVPNPSWIDESRLPFTAYCEDSKHRKSIGVLIEDSGTIPSGLYRRELGKLKAKTGFSVVVCIPSSQLVDDTKVISQELQVNLCVFDDDATTTVVTDHNLFAVPRMQHLPRQEGYFPQPILDCVQSLTRLSYREALLRCGTAIKTSGNNEQKVRATIKSTIQEVLEKFGGLFSKQVKPFLQLGIVEQVLKTYEPLNSDHFMHSFRVFLAGCPIIDTHYDRIRKIHEKYCIGSSGTLNVELSWLLAAIFHDIGKIKESDYRRKVASVSSLMPDIALEFKTTDAQWQTAHYQTALRTVSSLAFFTIDLQSGSWDGGVIEDRRIPDLIQELIFLYEQGKHGVIGAVDFLARVFQEAAAVDKTVDRPALLTHAVPAALAILMHDWKIHTNLQCYGLFPINMQTCPMSAMLAYIDAWDDFRRNGVDQRIYIKSYVVDKNGAKVIVEWGDTSDLDKEKKKYEAFKKYFVNAMMELTIEAGMAK